eukprot:gene37147-50112_t
MKSSSCKRVASLSTAIFCLFLSPSNLAINIRGATKMSLQSQQVSFSSSVPPASTKWAPDSWRKLPIKQPPNYLDEAQVEEVEQKLSKAAPLVFAGEVRTLQEELAKASSGQGFLLMGGDCAEAFSEFSVNHIRDTFRVILQMALVLTYGGSMPVIKIGRMAGQFAKPRTEPDE